MVWGQFGVDLGSVLGRSGVGFGSVWDRFGNVLWMVRGWFGDVLGVFGRCSRRLPRLPGNGKSVYNIVFSSTSLEARTGTSSAVPDSSSGRGAGGGGDPDTENDTENPAPVLRDFPCCGFFSSRPQGVSEHVLDEIDGALCAQENRRRAQQYVAVDRVDGPVKEASPSCLEPC